MAFRSSDYLQRNELVRYQLDGVIRAPGNNQHQIKNGYKFTINDKRAHFMIGIMPILRCSFSVKKLLTEQDMQRLTELQLLMALTAL